MEKRRRARINDSLSQLKMLILEAVKKDVSLILAGCIYFTYNYLACKNCNLIFAIYFDSIIGT